MQYYEILLITSLGRVYGSRISEHTSKVKATPFFQFSLLFFLRNDQDKLQFKNNESNVTTRKKKIQHCNLVYIAK